MEPPRRAPIVSGKEKTVVASKPAVAFAYGLRRVDPDRYATAYDTVGMHSHNMHDLYWAAFATYLKLTAAAAGIIIGRNIVNRREGR